MITASEARLLVEKNDRVFDELLERIGSAIESAARFGETELNLTGKFDDAIFKINSYPVWECSYQTPYFDDQQKKLVAELNEHGYSCAIKSYKYDANKRFNSMSDPSDPPDMRISYQFMVSW